MPALRFQILDFSKVESGRLDIEEVAFDLSVVIRDVNKMLSFAAERKGLKYVDDIEQLKSWKVIGDPGRLRQVLTNLLTNSIKFTSEGSVTMSVKVNRETHDVLEVSFTVEDTGIGIEEEVRSKLFKPFSQADSSTARRFGGTGLGLTISKNLVELMRGKILLESKLGVGTKASFWIPFHKAPYQNPDSSVVELNSIPERLRGDHSVSRPSSGQNSPPTPATHFKPGHPPGNSASGVLPFSAVEQDPQLSEIERKAVNVLVVEDNPVNQQIALKTIKKLGFPVNAVWNGQEALDYLQNPTADKPLPDIILMDVQMPIMDGYRATHTIRNAKAFTNNPDFQAMPIVAMTASAIQGDREKCETAGMNDYLAKPVKKPQLESMLIKWAIEGRRKRAELANTSARPSPRPQPEGPQNNLSFLSETSSSAQKPEQHLTSEIDRLEFAHRAAVERSSASASDLALREQQAEEKAITLRDDILIESGDDPKTRIGRNASDDGQGYHRNGGRSSENALTAENMAKFAQSDRLAQLKRDSTALETDNSSVNVTIGDAESAILSRTPTTQFASANGPRGQRPSG